MSYSYKRKHKGKKRRKNRGKNAYSRFQSPNSLMPRRTKATLKYAGSGTLSIVAGSLDADLYRANSMFDPQVAAGGHQPMLFDQYMNMYNKFTVIGSKLTVRFASLAQSTEGGNGTTVNVAVTSGNTIRSDEQYREQGPVVTKYIESGGGSAGVKTITVAHSPKKWFGVKNMMDNTEFDGTDAADCTEQSVYHIYATTPGQVAADFIAYTFEIEYIAIFSDPRNISQS